MAQQHAIRTEASADARTAARADQPVGDLVKDAIAETQELIKLEVALAKKEATREIAELKISAILFGVAAVVGILGTAMLLVALVLAMNPAPLAALVVGAVLLLGGAVAAFVAIKQLPTTILGRTRRRLGTNIKQLKEHVA